MKIVLLALISAALALGYLAMKKLDSALNAGFLPGSPPEQDCLRIGLVCPTAANGLVPILSRFSSEHPGTAVRLYCGAGTELLQGLAQQKLDFLILSEESEVPDSAGLSFRTIVLEQQSVRLEYGRLPVEPFSPGPAVQRLFWNHSCETQSVVCLLACLPVSPEQK